MYVELDKQPDRIVHIGGQSMATNESRHIMADHEKWLEMHLTSKTFLKVTFILPIMNQP